MKTKLPEGVPVCINHILVNEVPSGHPNENGTAMSYADRLERDQAIARAAYSVGYSEAVWKNHGYESADDYLNSEEFKKLVGEM